jgi:hypothetical protein
MISDNNAYRRSVLASKARVPFDASNKKHMLDFAKFVKYNSWVDGCRYLLEDPYSDIPTMIRHKIAEFAVSKLTEKV